MTNIEKLRKLESEIDFYCDMYGLEALDPSLRLKLKYMLRDAYTLGLDEAHQIIKGL